MQSPPLSCSLLAYVQSQLVFINTRKKFTFPSLCCVCASTQKNMFFFSLLLRAKPKNLIFSKNCCPFCASFYIPFFFFFSILSSKCLSQSQVKFSKTIKLRVLCLISPSLILHATY
ncbi:hypothetical protein CIPAW_08G098000 [Carya illinoinensis]|uniref:Uncharacterized protein n=1 Tax=Carya illinoinensis TaxID=32201 RepID=A0A8T1PS51_CARIL|nr:hypothetical protein CIPAW_08G098000 [Carya illinoinensis]